MGTHKRPFQEIVANKLITQLKAGTAPWQLPWEPGRTSNLLPYNPITGKRYKGINALHLISEGRNDQRWMTYKQAASVDAQVRRGETGTQIQFWKFTETQPKVGDDGVPLLDASGEPISVLAKLERPRLFLATVFNAGQIDGLPPLDHGKVHAWKASERAENILAASGADIRHGDNARAFYRVTTDSIHLPDRDRFPSADNYYAVALHELGHWTGHVSRLNRDLWHPYGSEGYAREELRAEIASMIIGQELGVGHDTRQHAAYVGSWVSLLQNDPFEIFRAAAEAEKIQEYIMGIVLEQVQERDIAQSAVEQQVVSAQPEVLSQASSRVDSDHRVAAARVELLGRKRTGEDFAIAAEWFDTVSESELGFSIPHDWTGHARVYGFGVDVLDDEKGLTTFLAGGAEPEAWGIFAQHGYGDYSMLKSVSTSAQADELLERLALIDAYSTVDEEQKAVKLARLNEARVRRDSDSTEEDLAAAKAARKDAEFVATVGDADLKRRIEVEERARAERAATQGHAGPAQAEKIFLDVPFKQKEKVKALGAKWDRQQQSWFLPATADKAPFAPWLRSGGAEVPRLPETVHVESQGRVYLAVPYSERLAAKAAGAAWDKTAKSWYVGPNAELAKLDHWRPENVPLQQLPAMSPREEFADALKSVGCVLSGDHPIMDGEKHRIAVEGEKFSKNSGSGFYVGHLDGHPAGYVKNNKTGAELKWKSKGYSLGPEEKARMVADAASKQRQRETELSKRQEQAAKRVRQQVEKLVPVKHPTAYMLAKGIEPLEGVLTDEGGKKTYLPAIDADGTQWSMQYIQEDGTKRFAADSKKEGCFHVVGGIDNLAKAPAIVICEGYATAASVALCLGHATVSAFDSGNLAPVAKALHDKFPEVPIIIAADDDRHLEVTQGVNPGRAKGFEAAALVGGKAIFPIFARGENSFPDGVDPVTPEKYREHLTTGQGLDDRQLAALAVMKQHSDFNDLATNSLFSQGGLWRQVRPIVHAAIERHHAEKIEDQRAVEGAIQDARPRQKVSMKLS